VLLDITMPGINGLAALSEITERFSDVRVIMLTMHEAREYAIQSLRGGAAGFIPKSAAGGEIKEAINAVMRGKNLRIHGNWSTRPGHARTIWRRRAIAR
jgi:DNA-binding NarL/FixJ family response regulator